MKKYISKIFILLPALILFLGFNYAIDPENLFIGERYEKGIADYLIQGKNVTNTFNFDERIFEKYFIGGMRKQPDIIILGSSREYLIDTIVLGSVASI